MDGFNWNMFRPQLEIMHKKRWSRKVAFASRKVAAGSGKVVRSVFSFDGYKLPDSKTQFKGIPTSFPILAGEIEMTMPGPNALHWPQSKIKDMGNYGYTFQARKCGLCYCPVLLSSGCFAVWRSFSNK
jgi:hypothetical protein